MDIEEELEELNKKIDKLSMLFRVNFGYNPHYIKIPMWLYIELLEESELDDDETKEDIYRGLKVCPTIAITEISEIEIF